MRVPDLRALRAFVSDACRADPDLARASAVVVPTRGAAEELRRTIEDRLLLAPDARSGAVLLPDLLTRGELYQRFHRSLPMAPALLSDFEREVLFRGAARSAARRGAPPPFRLRAGLIAEILAFYDELRRRDRTVADFDRLTTGSLEPSADIDRGAERMLRQTRFLVAAFTEFEARIAASGSIDEHGLRELLMSDGARSPYRRIVVTVADQAADPRGLWLADYDLLARIPGLERVDVVVTENVLASGFHERIHDALPGIEEERAGEPGAAPALVAPARAGEREGTPVCFTCRDREDELVDVARRLKLGGTRLDRTAVVFQRPLPYLYLARTVFESAGIPYQSLDALPLAAEPFAAAIDLVFAFITSEANRSSLVGLLSSPHWRFEDASGRAVTSEDVAAADAWLRERKYVGGWDRLASFADGAENGSERRAGLSAGAARAIRAAQGAAIELQPILAAPAASAQIDAIAAFVRSHERRPHRSDPWHERQLRARAAILGALHEMRQAHATHDEEPLTLPDLIGTIRRWIEGQTFSPRTGSCGVRMMDAAAAAFTDVDDARIVGLVEGDWPERSRRSIFYPASLLTQLGWPADADRLAAARARFHDLLGLPARAISGSTFTLEEDAIAAPSPFLEELSSRAGADLKIESVPPLPAARVFVHEALSQQPIVPTAVSGTAAAWLAVRASRSPAGDSMFHGLAGARGSTAYAVSHVERYLDCPFKYFAGHVLRIDEERDDESSLTPQERGQFLHAVFEQFFREWHDAGRRTITTQNVADAQAMFERVAEAKLASLGESDRELERNYLLGSAAAAGLAARAFAFEVEQGVDVVERLLEYTLEGEFEFTGADGARRVRLRAKADRIDLLADGTLRIIDYKLGKAPKPSRALQLPVYGVCAQQHLEGRHGRSWSVSRAGYVAFREKNAFVPLGGSSSLEEAVAAGQQRFLAAIDAIEAGAFPPRPDEPFMCTRCGYPTVCRKDYVGDE